MRSQDFKKGLLNMKGENTTLKLVLVVSIICIGILSTTLMNRSQIVTIVPPNLTETTWLDEKTAGQPYMQAWAIYLANSMGNATPDSVDMLKKSIGPFLDAGIYSQVMKRIDDQIDQIKRDRITLSFTPTRVYHDPKAPGTYFVEGSQGLEGITGNPIVKSVTFQLSIDVKGYRPVLTFISIKQGKAELPSEKKGDK